MVSGSSNLMMLPSMPQMRMSAILFAPSASARVFAAERQFHRDILTMPQHLAFGTEGDGRDVDTASPADSN